MRIVTLTTDFGYQDSYVAEMKGVILGVNSKARIVDLSHGIQPQHIHEAAFMIFLSYRYFPRGTIHLVVVDPGVGGSRRIILARTKKHYFIAPDNGVLTYVFNAEKESVAVREITNKKFFNKIMSTTFEGRDKMAPVAGHLSKKSIFSEVGEKIDDPQLFITHNPVMAKNAVYGEVIYIDHFGNVVTNVTAALLRGYEVGDITINTTVIAGMVPTYSAVQNAVLLATYGSSGFLEIAENCGSAAKRLNAGLGDKVVIAVRKEH